MKSFSKPETIVLKQHFERKLVELEEEKRSLQVFSGAFYTFEESMCMCISLFKQGYI
jgi:kinesin family protein 4/21/27